jgi:hypothetical protein
MFRTVLWQLTSDTSPRITCELEALEDGDYRLVVLKGEQTLPFMMHDYSDRCAAIESSITIYRKLKDNGFHDTPQAR